MATAPSSAPHPPPVEAPPGSPQGWFARLVERLFYATTPGFALRQLRAEMDEQRRALPAHAARLEVQMAELHAGVRDLGAEISRLARVLQDDAEDVRRQFADHRRHVERQLASLQATLSVQDRVLSRLAEASPAPGPPASPADRPVGQGRPSSLDRLDVALREALQPGRDQARECLRPALESLRRVWPGIPDRPLLDLAPGLGEWLELAVEAGLPAYGVDANACAVERCRQAGLEVLHDDPLAHLRALPDAVLGGVSSWGLPESLALEALLELLAEARRALIPGGALLLVMRDPGRLADPAAAVLDPLRRNLVPPALATVLVGHQGFSAPEILPLPVPEAAGAGARCPAAYALLARRP